MYNFSDESASRFSRLIGGCESTRASRGKLQLVTCDGHIMMGTSEDSLIISLPFQLGEDTKASTQLWRKEYDKNNHYQRKKITAILQKRRSGSVKSSKHPFKRLDKSQHTNNFICLVNELVHAHPYVTYALTHIIVLQLL
jgi:hypothetical protein